MLIDIFLQTQCEIGMISDREMLYMIEQGLRGGLSFVNNRYVKSAKGNIVDLDQVSSLALSSHLMHH